MHEAAVVSALEALHRDESDWEQWCDDVTLAARGLLDEGRGTGLWVFDRRQGRSLAIKSHGMSMSDAGLFGVTVRAIASALGSSNELAAEAFDALFPNDVLVEGGRARIRRVVGTGGPGRVADTVYRRMLASMAASDMLGLTSRPSDEIGLVVAVSQPVSRAPGRRELRRLAQLSMHFEAAARVRLRPSSVVGCLRPDGTFDLARSLPESTRERLVRDMRAIDNSRTRARRGDGEAALEAWRALSCGHLSLVETDRLGHRAYLLCENRPSRRLLRALTPLELDVVDQATRGLPNKAIAYSLGVHASEVSRSLASACAKVGARDTADLLRITASLERVTDVADERTGISLTTSEQSVLALVREGLSNDEIARRRGTSPRTVANQVAAVLRKTAATGRRRLITRAS